MDEEYAGPEVQETILYELVKVTSSKRFLSQDASTLLLCGRILTA